MMIDIDHTQLFSRRRKQLLAAILVFGGHLGFLWWILTRFTKLALVLLIFMLQTCYCTWLCTTTWLILTITKMKFQVSNFEKNQFEVEIFHFFSCFYHSVPHLAPYSKSSNEYIWFLVFLKTSSPYYLSFKTNINLLRCILRSQWANIAKLMFFLDNGCR